MYVPQKSKETFGLLPLAFGNPFCLFPQRIHLLKRHFRKLPAGARGLHFYMAKAGYEFTDRLSKRILRIDADKTRNIDKNEKYVPEFVFNRSLVFLFKGLPEFREFFIKLLHYLSNLVPVKPDTRRPRLYPVCFEKCRELLWDTLKD